MEKLELGKGQMMAVRSLWLMVRGRRGRGGGGEEAKMRGVISRVSSGFFRTRKMLNSTHNHAEECPGMWGVKFSIMVRTLGTLWN